MVGPIRKGTRMKYGMGECGVRMQSLLVCCWLSLYVVEVRSSSRTDRIGSQTPGTSSIVGGLSAAGSPRMLTSGSRRRFLVVVIFVAVMVVSGSYAKLPDRAIKN